MKLRFTFDQSKAAMIKAVTRRMIEIIEPENVARLAADDPQLLMKIEYAMKSAFLAGRDHERDNLIGDNWSVLK